MQNSRPSWNKRCRSNYCSICKKFFHKEQFGYRNPNSVNFNQDKNENKPATPSPTINSIQRGSYRPSHEHNRFPPAPALLPHPTHLMSPQPAQPPVNSSAEQSLYEIISLASSEDESWAVNDVSKNIPVICSISTSIPPDTDPCPRHRGLLYSPLNKKRGKKVNFLFDSGSSVNVIPLTLIKRLGASYDKLIEGDFDQFTSCNNSQVRIFGHCNLNVIFQDKINRNFSAYVSTNIYENIISSIKC